jgi:hypothetical protein
MVFKNVKPSKNIPTTPKKMIKGNAVLIGMANVVHQDISTNTKLDDGGLLRAQVEIMKFGILNVETNNLLLGKIKDNFNLRDPFSNT